MICVSSSRRSAGKSLAIDWPIISSAEYPKMRSAALFQLMTMLWRFLLMMASSEESTIASYKTSDGMNVDWLLTRRVLRESFSNSGSAADGDDILKRVGIVQRQAAPAKCS